ncbi:BLUF domain-containing protein [Sphingomicrobium astaxanthinifaciens]|uniref:BLUF domain-containing protein n=1 Tax=Sphingomicrobium astaxanthinifaciens TaxID=1227949 RepID=UPI001FCC2BB9|nr:BLUF domain-containing protein [Sphingomicrobium astaxanthinifaciens]MCJ7421439.1 BLUF domain-containing protein [Sphingomicrobium astaxanthinifaciens]
MSAPTGPITFKKLNDIIAVSRRNNIRRGLRSALYSSSHEFFQCLEGPARAIDRLIATLARDRRHRALTILESQRIADYHLPDPFTFEPLEADTLFDFCTLAYEDMGIVSARAIFRGEWADACSAAPGA